MVPAILSEHQPLCHKCKVQVLSVWQSKASDPFSAPPNLIKCAPVFAFAYFLPWPMATLLSSETPQVPQLQRTSSAQSEQSQKPSFLRDHWGDVNDGVLMVPMVYWNTFATPLKHPTSRTLLLVFACICMYLLCNSCVVSEGTTTTTASTVWDYRDPLDRLKLLVGSGVQNWIFLNWKNRVDSLLSQTLETCRAGLKKQRLRNSPWLTTITVPCTRDLDTFNLSVWHLESEDEPSGTKTAGISQPFGQPDC